MKRGWLSLIVPGMILAAAPLLAHHSFAAEYDDKKPATLKGTVSKFDWSNPHVYFFLDVTDASGKIVNWPIEWESRIELKRAGWTQDSLKVGDIVTVEGSLARDGSKEASGKSVTLRTGRSCPHRMRCRLRPFAPLSPSSRASAWPDGHVRLGIGPGELGYWANPSSLQPGRNHCGHYSN